MAKLLYLYFAFCSLFSKVWYLDSSVLVSFETWLQSAIIALNFWNVFFAFPIKTTKHFKTLFSSHFTDPLPAAVEDPPEGLYERHHADSYQDHQDGGARLVLPVQNWINKLGEHFIIPTLWMSLLLAKEWVYLVTHNLITVVCYCCCHGGVHDSCGGGGGCGGVVERVAPRGTHSRS